MTKREMVERDIPLYAASFNCTLEKARLDVESEYNEEMTETDWFYERTEEYVGS